MKGKHITAISILIFIVFYFISHEATAKEYGTPQLPPFSGAQNKNGRNLYAKTLSTFLHKIDEFIPSLSPSERTWLDKELEEYYKSKNINRYLAISKSKEYKSDNVKKHLESMIEKLDEIMKANKLNKEIYLWSRLSEDLMKVDFWSQLHILIVDEGLIDKNLFYSDANDKADQYLFYVNNAISPATSILKNIIQPYVNGELQN